MGAVTATGRFWDPLPGESAKAYAAFVTYLGQGENRSTEEVAKKHGKSLTVVGRWCTKWQWIARCEAHAKRMTEVETEKRELIAADLAIDWGKRQRELRELEHSTAIQGLAVVRRWVEQVSKLKRLRMKAHEVAKLLDVCSRVARLSAGLATNRDEISGVDGEPIRVEVAAAIAKVYGATQNGGMQNENDRDVVDVQPVDMGGNESH